MSAQGRVADSAIPASTARLGAMGAACGLIAGLVALWPIVAGRGYVLSYDMVFVPQPPIGLSALGLDGSTPRAVPTDAVIALLAHLVPADLLQHGLLLGIFVLAGSGAARWMSTWQGAGAAALVFTWNPYVLERLVIGHWAFLVGLAILPWAARSAASARLGAPAATARTCGWIVAASLAGATSCLLVMGAVLVVACWPGTAAVPGATRRAGWLLVVAGAASAPWILPALALPGLATSSSDGVAAFASRADTPLGLLPSLLTLGGIWNPAVWPAERGLLAPSLVLLSVVVAALALGGRRLLALRAGAGAGLAAAAVVGGIIAATGGFGPGRAVLRWVVVAAPGGGLLRDGQKFLAPLVLVVALAVGCTVERLLASQALSNRGFGAAALSAVALVAVPVLMLPSMAFGAGGRLESVAYPRDWSTVQHLLANAPPGDAASFPWTYYRRFAWNDDRVVLDPIPRLLARPVLANDALPLKTGVVAGESSRSARVTQAVASGAPLTEALTSEGVRFVVVHLPSAGSEALVSRLPGAIQIFRGEELAVLDLGPAAPPTDRPPGWVRLGWILLFGAIVGVASRLTGEVITRRWRSDC